MTHERILGITRRIPELDERARRTAINRFDRLTKPQGSLGRLEEIVCDIAAMRGAIPHLNSKRCVVVMAGDHGVTAEGVSAYPQEVTPQMVLNFLRGGAAINVFARQANAKVIVVDAGVAGDLPSHPDLRSRNIARGTANFAAGPAMSRDQAIAAIISGIDLAHELAAENYDFVATGDMGIGNTTASSAITAVLARRDPVEVTGRGTGVADEALARKVKVIRRAIELNRPDPDDALDVVTKLGGFEIAGLAGLIIGCAARRIPVMIDGFISGAAALIAASLAPRSRDYMMASHCSSEPGHCLALEHLRLKPLLNLDLRLGEGTGAAIAFLIVDSGIRALHEMATFDEAGVSKRND